MREIAPEEDCVLTRVSACVVSGGDGNGVWVAGEGREKAHQYRSVFLECAESCTCVENRFQRRIQELATLLFQSPVYANAGKAGNSQLSHLTSDKGQNGRYTASALKGATFRTLRIQDMEQPMSHNSKSRQFTRFRLAFSLI